MYIIDHIALKMISKIVSALARKISSFKFTNCWHFPTRFTVYLCGGRQLRVIGTTYITVPHKMCICLTYFSSKRSELLSLFLLLQIFYLLICSTLKRFQPWWMFLVIILHPGISVSFSVIHLMCIYTIVYASLLHRIFIFRNLECGWNKSFSAFGVRLWNCLHPDWNK